MRPSDIGGSGFPSASGSAFGAGFRGIGIWIGLATGLGVVAGLMLWRWMRRDRLRLVALPIEQSYVR